MTTVHGILKKICEREIAKTAKEGMVAAGESQRVRGRAKGLVKPQRSRWLSPAASRDLRRNETSVGVFVNVMR
jgi:hypothetical protein